MTGVIVKLIGSAVILGASVYYGQIKIRAERRKIEDISSFAELVKHIGECIEYFSQPLPEIFNEYRNEHLDNSGFMTIVKSKGLMYAVQNCGMSFGREELDNIIKFAQTIGKGYREEEVSLCRYTYSKLTDAEEKKRTALKDKEKLYRTIPPMLALSVILILI